MTDVRKAAMAAVKKIVEEGGYCQLVLSAALQEGTDLSAADRRLLTQIVYRTVTFLGPIDRVIGEYSKTPLKKLDGDVRAALRIGICQLLFMDGIRPYAAVSSTVEAIKRSRSGRFSGYVNAVLRSVLRSREAGKLEAERRMELPAWLFDMLRHDYGEEKASQLESLFAEEKPLCIRLDAEDEKKASVLASLRERMNVLSGSLCPDAYYLGEAGSIRDWPEFVSGAVSVQDESSMAAAWALIWSLGKTEKDRRILDMCAAPGSKSCMIAKRIRGTVVSRDIHPSRVRLIEENSRRLRLSNLIAQTADALALREEDKEAFDAVLLDAPCSGIGTIRSKPDIVLRRTKDDVDDLSGLQRRMMENAAFMLKKGGVLIYSTCTLLRQENDEQVRWFLRQHPEFEELDLSPHFPGKTMPDIKHMTLWPQKNGYDGFFVAAFKKGGEA